MDTQEAKRVLETALLCAQAPLTLREMRSLFVDELNADSVRSLLDELLRLYWLGQTVPLPLFPKASRVYAERCTEGGDAQTALEAARREFVGSAHTPVVPEAEDDYVRQLFDTHDPLDPTFRFFTDAAAHPSFAHLALAVFVPLLAHRQDWP